ncbi:SGNH/GDSL hydrolase family protein [Methylocystis sp. B8]|uniref:SGNH/GDSL hydrolase family protein n=1 Tax=Methylocystis sp. B8 TaxID=544938 RepID=UPI0010FE89CE|nr:SGNH/GDSL hydrolase family protein [Methylocystis sp. B8]TLG71453.1 SGNH/GDSL hydrolase family protein [Methylocystis sp. B8]
MRSWSAMNALWKLCRILLINLGLLLCLALVAEIVLHIIYRGGNPFLAPAKNELRVRDPHYTHGLKPNFNGFDAWGSNTVRIFTNSLGFRDAAVRDVPMATDRKRIVFIGDSFAESLGVPYEESFIGLFAQAFPAFDVLNAGVSSYAPSVYYEKLKYFLDAGLKFDEAVVYIDISDIQDEATLYSYDQNGVLQMGLFQTGSDECSPIPRPPLQRPEKQWWEKISYMDEFLGQMRYSAELGRAIGAAKLEDLSKSRAVYSRDYARASWTYSENSNCYGALGIEASIDKAKKQMDRLYELLSSRGIALSVGVYPWPQQLLYDVENSRQARIWREWCAGKCRRFFNHFPDFFEYKAQDPDFIRSLYFWGDFHFNGKGNALLAQGLIKNYE